MSIAMVCPSCARKLKAPPEVAGKRVACPGCKTTFTAPTAQTTSSPPAAVQSATPKLEPAQAKSAAAAPSVPQRLTPLVCPQCAKQLRAPAELAGKSVRCPDCKTTFTIPGPAAARPAWAAPASEKFAKASAPVSNLLDDLVAAAEAAPAIPRPKPAVATRPQSAPPSIKARRIGARPRFAYFAFTFAMVPLVLQSFAPDTDIEQRVQSTVQAHPELEEPLNAATSDEEVFALLPDGRLEGAHLSRETWQHWIYAALAACAFLAMIWLLFELGECNLLHLLLIGLTTATVGILSLIMFQWLADASQGVWVRGRGVLVLLFYVVKFIGFSYHAALDPENGFLLSFFGFTLGVGLCEEFTKAFPVLAWLGSDRKLDWRGACALGLASGVGFGVAEGIMYSANYYNGIASADIYFSRFISCVALHATWTAAVGIMAARNQAELNSGEGSDWIQNVLLVIAVPAILHGLYDTLLKKEMTLYALAIALASFVWLAIMVELARAGESALERPGFAAATNRLS